MKKVMISALMGALILMAGCQNQDDENTLSFSGAFALYPMVVLWGDIYQETNPEIDFDIAAGGAGKGMSDALAGMVDIAMVSREISPEEVEKGAWFVAVTHDAVLPMMNANNPYYAQLIESGLTKEQFTSVFIDGTITDWETLLGVDSDSVTEINVYTRADSCGAAATWAKFMGGSQDTLLGIGVSSDPGLCEAVRTDTVGIGFNNVNYAYDHETRAAIDGVHPIPIDINENGMIDDDEKIYDTLDSVTTAISLGKYPSPPARDLYLVCLGAPTNEVVINFIEWVLTDGQSYLMDNGYVPLPEERRTEQLEYLLSGSNDE